MTSGALAGLRVLDISSFLAAPQVATILGDFGANVIKIEPPRGEALRRIGAQRNGESLVWAMVSRNKRTITLDLEQEAGRDLFRRLVGQVGVLVHNYSPQILSRWGCTWDDLRAINPDLVMVTVSCYGTTGPLADRPGAGTLAEAFGGLTHLTGEADGPPMLPSVPLGDTLTGIMGVLGALIACYHRDVNGGGGQHVDVSMYEPILTLLGSTIAAWDADGEPAPHRTGSRIPTGVPRNVYRTGDGDWVVLSGTTDRQVERILAIIGADDDSGRARFAKAPDRLANADQLDGLVADWIGGQPTPTVLETFVEARVPIAPVHDFTGLLSDPQVVARSSIVRVDGGEQLGPVPMAAPAPVLSATPGTIDHPGPPIGAHTAEVYAELLGLTAADLDGLRSQGLI